MQKKINFLIYKKINLIIYSLFFKIFKNIKIKLKGLEVTVLFKKKNLINYLTILKKNSAFLFNILVDIIIEDFPKKKNRFFLKYIIRSLNFCKFLQIFIKTKEYKPVFSIINIYKSSFWLEREAWDLFGVFFLHNKDLRRLLTDYGFKGKPFKKDFPLLGFLEIYFDFFYKKLKYKKVKKLQKKQNFYNNIIFCFKKKIKN